MKEPKKNGRPKLAEGTQRDKVLAVKMNAFEMEYVSINARNANLKPSIYAREVLQGNLVKARMSEKLVDEMKQVYGMANNLNQIAHQANIGRLPYIQSECMNLLGEIMKFIKKISKL
jgi:hypothetical protein